MDVRKKKSDGRRREAATLRARHAEMTREALERAALEECRLRGFRGLQVQHITRRAGCAVGTFYLHFDDKEDVVRELMRRHAAELRQHIAMRFRRATSAEEAIRGSHEAFLDFVENNRAAFSLLFREGWMADPRFVGMFREIFQGFLEETRRRLEAGQAAGALERMDADALEITSWAMVGALFTSAQEWLEGSRISKQRLVDQLVSLWVRAIAHVSPARHRQRSPLPKPRARTSAT